MTASYYFFNSRYRLYRIEILINILTVKFWWILCCVWLSQNINFRSLCQTSPSWVHGQRLSSGSFLYQLSNVEYKGDKLEDKIMIGFEDKIMIEFLSRLGYADNMK